jgi:hypothetical protein
MFVSENSYSVATIQRIPRTQCAKDKVTEILVEILKRRHNLRYQELNVMIILKWTTLK